MRSKVMVAVSLLIFGFLNYAIYEKEQIIAKGEVVLLQLAPVDPRSLMQGDYMRLNYAIGAGSHTEGSSERGLMVIAADENKVAHFVRFYTGENLKSGEKLLHYHRKGPWINIVPDSFMFQEGHAEKYAQAKYGVFKFDDAGNSLLTGLADAQFKMIQPE